MNEPRRLTDRLREFLKDAQGKEVDLMYLRRELKINPDDKAWEGIRPTMLLLVKEKIVKPSGRNDGVFKVIKQVKPVRIFGKERREPVTVYFPRDFHTMEEMFFAKDIVIREGNLILLSGESNFGKTLLAISFCGENLGAGPILMGNEYTTIDGEPDQRFLNRLDRMDWFEWCNGDGMERFTLLPVRDDYAEHIVKDKINIIDWINLEEHYKISPIMEGIKKELGRGVGIICIQKAKGSDMGRGGQFTKDFADVELLLDALGKNEVRLTIGKVKESTAQVAGRTFGYSIHRGIKIINFREIVKCHTCWGKGWKKAGNSSVPCDMCDKTGYLDKRGE